jgi:hypothetical protein
MLFQEQLHSRFIGYEKCKLIPLEWSKAFSIIPTVQVILIPELLQGEFEVFLYSSWLIQEECSKAGHLVPCDGTLHMKYVKPDAQPW